MHQRTVRLRFAAWLLSSCLGVCQKIASRIGLRAGERMTCSTRSGGASRISRPQAIGQLGRRLGHRLLDELQRALGVNTEISHPQLAVLRAADPEGPLAAFRLR